MRTLERMEKLADLSSNLPLSPQGESDCPQRLDADVTLQADQDTEENIKRTSCLLTGRLGAPQHRRLFMVSREIQKCVFVCGNTAY